MEDITDQILGGGSALSTPYGEVVNRAKAMGLAPKAGREDITDQILSRQRSAPLTDAVINSGALDVIVDGMTAAQKAKAAISNAVPQAVDATTGAYNSVNPLVNQTVVPKGGDPEQIRLLEAKARGVFDDIARSMSEEDSAQAAAKDVTRGEALFKSASDQYLNNLLGAPAGVITQGGIKPFLTLMSALGHKDMDPSNLPPGVSLVPRPTVGGLLGEDPNVRRAVEERYPIATGTGEVVGDIGSLLTGKAPMAGKIRNLELKAAERIEEAAARKASQPKYVKTRAEARQRFWNGPGANKLMRWGGRTAEAGLEGAALSIVQSKDPVELAAFSAGSQAILGPLGTFAIHETVGGKGIAKGLSLTARFALNTAALGTAIEALNHALPGEQLNERDYEARNTVIDKAIYATMIGATATALSGRKRTGMFSTTRGGRQIIEGITSVPRHTMTSIANYVLSKPEGERQRYIDALADQTKFTSMTQDQLKQWHAATKKGSDATIKWIEENLL